MALRGRAFRGENWGFLLLGGWVIVVWVYPWGVWWSRIVVGGSLMPVEL